MKKLMFLLAAASLSSVAFAQQKSNSQNVLVVHKYCSAISPILVNSRNVLLPLFKYQSANGLLPA